MPVDEAVPAAVPPVADGSPEPILTKCPLTKYATWPVGMGGMSTGQRRAHLLQGPNVAVRGGNQTGLSTLLAAEIHWQALGNHPYRAVDRRFGVSICLLCGNGVRNYANFCQRLRALEVPGSLDPRCEYTKQDGYWFRPDPKARRQQCLVYANGYRIQFDSSAGDDAGNLAYDVVDALFADTIPPYQKWALARSRLRREEGNWGRTLIAFTPIGRQVDRIRWEIEGDKAAGIPPKEEWVQTQIRIDVGGFMSNELVERLVSVYAESPDCDQRLYGDWPPLQKRPQDLQQFIAQNARVYEQCNLIPCGIVEPFPRFLGLTEEEFQRDAFSPPDERIVLDWIRREALGWKRHKIQQQTRIALLADGGIRFRFAKAEVLSHVAIEEGGKSKFLCGFYAEQPYRVVVPLHVAIDSGMTPYLWNCPECLRRLVPLQETMEAVKQAPPARHPKDGIVTDRAVLVEALETLRWCLAEDVDDPEEHEEDTADLAFLIRRHLQSPPQEGEKPDPEIKPVAGKR